LAGLNKLLLEKPEEKQESEKKISSLKVKIEKLERKMEK
jgi:hypothetical protein